MISPEDDMTDDAEPACPAEPHKVPHTTHRNAEPRSGVRATAGTPDTVDPESGVFPHADPSLVERVRQGDVDASLILWRRHAGTARSVATRLVAGGLGRVGATSSAQTDRSEGSSVSDDVDDLVNRSFARVIREIAGDEDPVAPFLLYLGTTLVLEASATLDAVPPEPGVLRAFRRLQGTCQTALWYTVVEPVSTATLGAVLGLDLAGTERVLCTATSRLRSEWIAEIVADPSVPDSCAWLAGRVDAHDAAALGDLATQRYERHLDGCTRCQSTVADLDRFPELLGTTVRGLLDIP